MSKFKILVFLALCISGCANREDNTTIKNFSPEMVVLNLGKQNNLAFSETGQRQQGNSRYLEKRWHYFSDSKVDDIEVIALLIRQHLREELIGLGNKVHGSAESHHAFIVYDLSYSQGTKRGILKITAAKLEAGTAIDVSIYEF